MGREEGGGRALKPGGHGADALQVSSRIWTSEGDAEGEGKKWSILIAVNSKFARNATSHFGGPVFVGANEKTHKVDLQPITAFNWSVLENSEIISSSSHRARDRRNCNKLHYTRTRRFTFQALLERQT